MGERICSIDGCPKAVRARGWCGTHYSRWYTKGHPLAIVGYGLPEAERFWPKVDASGDCWIWTANRSSAGYGNFYTAAQRSIRSVRTDGLTNTSSVQSQTA